MLIGRRRFQRTAIVTSFVKLSMPCRRTNRVLSPLAKTKKATLSRDLLCFSRGRTRTYDLRVMSPTSCQLLYPASMLRKIYIKRERMSRDAKDASIRGMLRPPVQLTPMDSDRARTRCVTEAHQAQTALARDRRTARSVPAALGRSR